MVETIELPTQIDRGGHRNYYFNRLYEITNKGFGTINTNDIPRFICNLQNWGMYTKYNEIEFVKGFNDMEKELMGWLNENWDVEVRKCIHMGMSTVLSIIKGSEDFRKYFYHSELIDDLKMYAGLMVKNEFYSFLTKRNIYSEEARIWTEKWLYENDFGELLKEMYK